MASSEKTVRDTLQWVLALVKTADAKAQALVSLTAQHTANTRFANNEITSGGDVEEMALSLQLALGLRTATATTNQVDDASLKTLVERVLAMAKHCPEDPELMPVLGPQTYGKSPMAFDPEIERLETQTRARIAKEAIDTGRSSALQMAGYLEQNTSLEGHATSAGLIALHPSTSLSVSMTARTKDGTGSGHVDNVSRRFKGIDAVALAAQACATAVASAKPKRLEPGRYTVILEPLAAMEIASSFQQVMSARRADEGRSFFSKPGGGTREGEELLSKLVTLRSDWSSAEAPGLPFDNEGLPLKPVTWVDQGTITTLAADRYWAKTHHRTVTGAFAGLVMSPGASTREALIRGVQRGVLISRFWYTNFTDREATMLTGLTRDGTFLIENGELVGSVNNFRFNQSLALALKNVDALESRLSLTDLVDCAAPALRTHEFNLASTSDAV